MSGTPGEGTTFLFIIDTDSYSGNFERELCGAMTGVDDGTHGGREATRLLERLQNGPEDQRALQDRISGKVTFWPDDKRYDRCATIWPTPGRVNNGRGEHFDEDQGSEGFYLNRPWPAYESVAIYFNAEPSPGEIAFMIARAREFEVEGAVERVMRSNFKIRGFRLVRYVVEVKRSQVEIGISGLSK